MLFAWLSGVKCNEVRRVVVQAANQSLGPLARRPIVDGMTSILVEKVHGNHHGTFTLASIHLRPSMSPAHACFRSALAQAFRPSNSASATTYSVASFLVPALTQPAKRSFSATHRRRKDQTTHTTKTPPVPTAYDIDGHATYQFSPKPLNAPPKSCINFPLLQDRGDVKQWLEVIDPFLPPHLREQVSEGPDQSSKVTSTDLALVLNAAQASNIDILSYLGLVQEKWPTVIWMVKKLAGDGTPSIGRPKQLDLCSQVHWPESESRSLDLLTETPLRFKRVGPRKLELSLDELTAAPETIDRHYAVTKRALGQLWRSLGSMILAATERGSADDAVMPHVLEMIAHLHHMGFIPDSVYSYHPRNDQYALQQPPTLHMLSSKILTALSDAAWKAHEESMRLSGQSPKASYFLGQEIPRSRYKAVVSEVAPELWLELVLWSCLHGGWTLDGITILETMANKRNEHGWGLISWREILQAEQTKSQAFSSKWKLFSAKEVFYPTAEDRARTRKTISSEVVTAFIDAIVNDMRVAVGSRGVGPESIIRHIKILKGFLDSNNLSLGSASWDSVMARLLESGGIASEGHPELWSRMFKLAAGFGAEVGSANTSAIVPTEVPYFFEPTTLPLNLAHQTMRAFINNGNIKDAMATFMLLQHHTDENKQRSLHQFFEMLKSLPPRRDTPFTSGLPPVDFPAFDTNLPIPLRAKLLDLATECKEYDLGRWILFSQDLDGPLIGRDLYNHRNVAASIVRFGTLAGENDLVLEVIKRVSTWNPEHQQQRMPAEVLIALLCCQIKLRRWNSVRGMQQYIVEAETFRPLPIILATFAAELLRTCQGSRDETLKAQGAFAELLFAWENRILSKMRDKLYCILSIMSTVDTDWRQYCSRFLGFSSRHKVTLSTQDFNIVLQGILDAYGSSRGEAMIKIWCYQSPIHFVSYRSSGGLSTMPRYPLGKATEYEQRPENIVLEQESGATLTFQGRVYPNYQTIWAVLRKVQEEVEQRRFRGEELTALGHAQVGDTIKWAARMLYHLGYDYDEIVRGMGSSLAKAGGLEAQTPSEEEELEFGAC